MTSLSESRRSALRVAYAGEASNLSPTLDTTKDIASLAMTCKSLHAFFQPLVKGQLLKHLMLSVLRGEPEKARKLYMRNPELLFMRVSARDFGSGLTNQFEPVYRIINSTPVRAMVGGGDVWMLDEVWKALPDYRDRIIEQIHQQFPNGFKYPQATFDYTALVEAIYADRHLKFHNIPNQNTVAELEKFRTHFLPNQNPTKETIGHHFNMNEYEDARIVFEAHWRPWSGNQCSLFFRQVIGLLQGLFAVADSMTWLQYPEKVGMPGGNCMLNRNLKLINDANHGTKESLFSRALPSMLGRDRAICINGSGTPQGVCLGSPAGLASFTVHACNAEKKNHKLTELIKSHNQRNQPGV